MRQEHLFVAELYRYLAPFVDIKQDLYLSLDGIAAKRGVTQKHFEDETVPDLWFTVLGCQTPILLEAKIVEKGKVTVGKAQLSAWRSQGRGKHRPIAWVGSTETMSRFYFWTHQEFLANLDACTSTVAFPKVKIPADPKEFSRIEELALHVLRGSVTAYHTV